MRDTDDRLKEIEARASAATPGPWEKDTRGGGCIRGGALVHKLRGSGQPQIALAIAHEDEDADSQTRNADFIAAARSDVPWLLDQVRQLSARLAEAEGLLREASVYLFVEELKRAIAAFLAGKGEGK